MVWLPPQPCALPGRGSAPGGIAGTILGGPRCARGAQREREGPRSGHRSPKQGNRRLGRGEKPLNQEKCSGVRGQGCSQLGAPAEAPSA